MLSPIPNKFPLLFLQPITGITLLVRRPCGTFVTLNSIAQRPQWQKGRAKLEYSFFKCYLVMEIPVAVWIPMD